ncbi:hypothetical protein [Pedobacter sp. B4-66]|uniref:hypothetical protein n=1 Tax=Pedobacter sp. B4-66 TaxID=2817280 RepID=UPI001BDAB653|nr:hypothetical protein [Pedobacter sp. B4-66]
MKEQKILKFIESNSKEDLKDFYNTANDKLKELSSKLRKQHVSLIVVVFLFTIGAKSSIESFQVGPVSISDVSIIIKLLPILFSYLLLDIFLTSNHKSETSTAVKMVSMAIYNQESSYKDIHNKKSNLISRILLPFSYSIELTRFNNDKTNIFQVIFKWVVYFPLVFSIVLPASFEYYMLQDIFRNHFNDVLGKISFISTIWINLITIYYMISSANSKE